MTLSDFYRAMLGEPHYIEGTNTRARHVLADALDERAKERRAEGRPDKSGQLLWAATRVRHGDYITKRVVGKLRADLVIVQSRLVSP